MISDMTTRTQPIEGPIMIVNQPTRPRCELCRWWEGTSEMRPGGPMGECRALPPTGPGDAQWPMTCAMDFCGGFSPTEEAIIDGRLDGSHHGA